MKLKAGSGSQLRHPEIEIIKIVIGDRHRKDLGDIDGLAKSISKVGLLHPVVVTTGYMLIAGRRRIEAFKRLGREKIPVRVLDLDAVVLGERDENMLRKDFTASEAVAIGEEIERLERERAKERQAVAGPKEGRGKKTASGNLPEAVKGDTRDKVAKAVGMSGRTYEKAKQVVEAAKVHPELLPVVEEMDRTGKVDPAYKKVRRSNEAPEQRQDQPREGAHPECQVSRDAVASEVLVAAEKPPDEVNSTSAIKVRGEGQIDKVVKQIESGSSRKVRIRVTIALVPEKSMVNFQTTRSARSALPAVEACRTLLRALASESATSKHSGAQ